MGFVCEFYNVNGVVLSKKNTKMRLVAELRPHQLGSLHSFFRLRPSKWIKSMDKERGQHVREEVEEEERGGEEGRKEKECDWKRGGKVPSRNPAMLLDHHTKMRLVAEFRPHQHT